MKNSKGQSLLLVIVLMTIALAIGIAISLRVLSNLGRSTQTDTSSRVQAVAEGGAENFLVKSLAELAASTAVCDGNYSAGVPTECQVDFDATAVSDNIDAFSAITVQPYGQGSDDLPISVETSSVVEVNLKGFTGDSVLVCWNEETVLHYIEYSDTDIEKDVRSCVSCSPSVDISNISPANPGSSYSQPHNQCIKIDNVSGELQGLRLRSLGGSSNFIVVPQGGDLPVQGYEITSEAELTDLDTNEKVVKTVKVKKSLPYLPSVFDYGIYSDTGVLD